MSKRYNTARERFSPRVTIDCGTPRETPLRDACNDFFTHTTIRSMLAKIGIIAVFVGHLSCA
jgi:hypothetical protein